MSGFDEIQWSGELEPKENVRVKPKPIEPNAATRGGSKPASEAAVSADHPDGRPSRRSTPAFSVGANSFKAYYAASSIPTSGRAEGRIKALELLDLWFEPWSDAKLDRWGKLYGQMPFSANEVAARVRRLLRGEE